MMYNLIKFYGCLNFFYYIGSPGLPGSPLSEPQYPSRPSKKIKLKKKIIFVNKYLLIIIVNIMSIA